MRVAELDVLVKFVGPTKPVTQCRELVPPLHRLDTLDDGDGGLHGILALAGTAANIGAGCGFCLESRARARQPPLSRDQRDHHDGGAGILAVGPALHAHAAADEGRLRIGDVARQLVYGLGRDLRDGLRPLGRLCHHVVARAHDVVLVGLVLPPGRFRHGLLVVAHGVGVEEFLVG